MLHLFSSWTNALLLVRRICIDSHFSGFFVWVTMSERFLLRFYQGLPDQWKVDPSLVQPIVAKISMQTGTNNGTSRSGKRRSQPPPSRVSGNEVALDLSSVIATATKSAPTTPVAKTPVSGKSRSNSRSSAQQQQAGSVPTSSSPMFANLSRVPPPSAELLDNGAPGTSSTAPSMLTATSLSSQFSAGTSVESQNTLVSLAGSPVHGGALSKGQSSVGKAPVLSAVRELHTPTSLAR